MLLSDLTTRWLKQHVMQLDAPERYAASVQILQAFWDYMRGRNLLPEPLTVGSISRGLIDEFVAWRAAQGASAPTISRDLAALRGPISWGLGEQLISSAPRIKDVKHKKGRKSLEWDPEQIAVLLEAAYANEDRRHVFLFMMIMLSTHARAEATLELNADTQIKRGLIDFLRPGEAQTRKRRAIVPICPTLQPWLDSVSGKVIVYRAAISPKRQVPGGPTHFERETANIGNAFEGVLLEAHRRRPDLGFARPVLQDGRPVMLPARRKIGETEPRPKLTGIGSPNTLRHTIHTWHKTFGVPDAQIDAAAGHSEKGTGANYTHLRPDYLREFIESTEAFWSAVSRYTSVHVRYRRDTTPIALGCDGNL